jgi:MinD superfamily P-loop ATPase
MNKQINLVINGKGGVGKASSPRNFVQYLRDCGIAHCAIDSDHENAILKRFISVATPDVAKTLTLLPLSRDAVIARCLPCATPPQAAPRPSFRQRVITAVCSESLTRLQLGA